MNITVHKVGNKINGEPLILSREELVLDDNTKELLTNYFLNSFKSEETFQFYSDSYLTNNPIYNSVSEIFEDKNTFQWQSEVIARHLYEIAENPRVQEGELFVVYFPKENENDYEKIGLFKTEKREDFLKIFPQNKTFDIEKDRGISLSKIDKATLIYNKDKETGYVMSVVDNNKNGDMYYWFEDFLKVRQRDDEFFHTQESLAVIKDFVKNRLPEEFEVSKLNQVEILGKSIEYFQEKEEFNYDEFVNEVLEDETVIESFSSFKSDYEQDMQISISEDFPINNQVVKKQQRYFKSVIKLDDNFQIQIKDGHEKMETGTDDKGNYYKLYFEYEK